MAIVGKREAARPEVWTGPLLIMEAGLSLDSWKQAIGDMLEEISKAVLDGRVHPPDRIEIKWSVNSENRYGVSAVLEYTK